uniref:Putative paramyosin n=1 Tax=Panstrongylus lignarius TaxID=156445 RepID=A0A224XIX5_9HEMI
MKILLLIFTIFFMDLHKVESNRAITHEDIRDAILSMVHLFRDTTDKLERHELRERQLGEQLKKALSSLDKRERAQDHLLNGIVSKLNSVEDRLRKMESALQQDEAAKGRYTIDTIPLESWMSNVEGMLSKQSTSNELLPSKDKLDAMEAAYNSKMDHIASLIEKLQSEVLTTSARMSSLFEQQREHNSIEHKKWHGSIISQMESQSNKLAQMRDYSNNNIDNGSITEEIRLVKDDIMSLVNGGLHKLESKFKELDYSIHSEEKNMIDVMAEGRQMMDDYFRKIHEKFETLSNDIDALEKMEKILIKTDENVLDTKRKIEFMMFQIIKGVDESISSQSRDLNDTINGRFNTLSDTLVDNENITLVNVSKKIESEMEQVWRQIGILYTQLTASAAVLNDLQSQTHVYVNQSNSKMEKMDNQLAGINTHVNEIHENVNYFMGRLSLVTQEFNQTRNALAKVVDSLKIDLDKPRDDKHLGNGPIPIDSNLI